MVSQPAFTRIRARDLQLEIDALALPKLLSLALSAARLAVLRKIHANVNMATPDMARLYPLVLQMMGTDLPLEARKICYSYVAGHLALVPDCAPQTLKVLLPTITAKDTNYETVLVLRCLSAIPLAAVAEHVASHCVRLTRAADSMVQRTAAHALARIADHLPDVAAKHQFVDELNRLLYDQSPPVVGAALAALNDITLHQQQLELMIDAAHADHLVLLLLQYGPSGVCYVTAALLLYTPMSTDDAQHMVHLLVPFLQHQNAGVVLNTLRCVVYMLHYAPVHAGQPLSLRIGAALVHLLARPLELQFLALRNVILLLLSQPRLVHLEVELFFCRYDDVLYVKDTKLEIIYLLARPENLRLVLRELEEYATEVDQAMARKAVRAIGNLAVKIPEGASACVELLLDLVATGLPHLVQESVLVFRNVLRRYPNQHLQALPLVVEFADVVGAPDESGKSHAEARAALVWIAGQYGLEIPNSNALLQKLSQDFVQDPPGVQLAILTAATKHFVTSLTPESEALVVHVIKQATEECSDPDIRDRGFFYWHLLLAYPQDTHQDRAKAVVAGEVAPITSDPDRLEDDVLDELELNIGTLALVYLKPVALVFRLAKPRTFRPSPALVSRDRLPEKELPSLGRQISPINDPLVRTVNKHAVRHEQESDDEFVETSKAKPLPRRLQLLSRSMSMLRGK